ncbi:unnamed protein product [Brassica oleracea var. botrytis]|uniref:(rape) hypothetical protein n=1 Tax=Brassica napus TaxID=3708 RepID=A0A816IET6_BRANA|nr:unnamed protein product [Brassica napus]
MSGPIKFPLMNRFSNLWSYHSKMQRVSIEASAKSERGFPRSRIDPMMATVKSKRCRRRVRIFILVK